MMEWQLTDSDMQRFADDGYVAIRGATTVDEVERVRAIVESLVERRAGIARGDYLDLVGDDRTEVARVPQILMPARYASELADAPLRAHAERIARALLGGPVVYEGEHLITKPPSCAPDTPLHQDEAFWGENTEYHSLSIWFPLQDADEDNGCLRFVPGSHRLDVVPHRSIGGDRANNGLEVVDAERFRPVSLPLRRGDASVHHCRTIHGSGPNRSDRPRHAYIFGFGLPARAREQPREFGWLRDRVLVREARARQAGYEPTRMRPEL
jgi:hypothetical protein